MMVTFYNAEGGGTSVGIRFRSSRWYMPLVAGLLLSLLGQIDAGAAVINAASPSLVDVSTAIASAVDGDTVIVPPGTAIWSSSLVVTKGITIIGQTTVDSAAGTANDQTIILVGTGSSTDKMLIYLNTALGKTYRISGLTFRTGQTTRTNSNGMIYIGGTLGASSQAVRVDHCHFDDLTFENEMIGVWTAVFGIIDHNLFNYRTGPNRFTVNVNMPDWGGQTQGHGSWAEPAYYGSEKFIFIESNYINNSTTHNAGAIDGQRGGRYVYRYNHVFNTWATNHGTETGPYRGLRCMEVYNNDFHWTGNGANGTTSTRGGGLIIHDNTNTGTPPVAGYVLGSYRSLQKLGPWGGGTGDNPWDVNDISNGTFTNCANPALTGATSPTSNTGTFNYSPINGLYVSGTVSSGTNTTLVDTTKTWGTNQWAGFTVKRLSDNGMMLILSNTSNTLTGTDQSSDGYSPQVVWTSGDQYQIHRALIVMDQPGRVAGDLLSGSTTQINTTTGTASWPHEALEPCYSWNDASIRPVNGDGIGLLLPNRDYYNGTPMPGYTPYTYPHPLVTGVPTAPQNLRVTGP